MKKLAIIATALIALTALTSAEQGSAANLDIDIVTKEPAPLQAGEYANVWLEVRNTGEREINDIEVSFKESYPFSIEDSERDKWEFDSLARGDSRQIRAQVRVDNRAVQGENTLKFMTETDQGVGIEHRLPAEVRVDDTSLVIREIDYPERVAPGATNTMELELENLANGYFRNIDIQADVESEDLTAVGSSRERLPLMDPLSTETVDFRINVDEDADNGVYRVPLNFRYQNEMGDEIETSQTAGIVVGGEPRLDVGIENTDIRTAGVRDTVTFNIINKGDGQAGFVDLELQDSDQFEIISENQEYLGSMISDDYQTAEFDVYVEDDVQDKITFPVELEYNNEQGESTTTEFEVERRLYSSDELDRYGLTERGGSILAIVAVLAVIAGGVYYWRRKKRNSENSISE